MHTDQVCQLCGTQIETESATGTCPHCQVGPTLGGPKAGLTLDFRPSDLARLMVSLPSLEILEEIGRGGMGVVYKARHVKMDRLVALKVIRPDSDRDSAFAERFSREARAMARLNHPNILTIYDFGEADGLYYLVMELVDGQNLRHRLKAGRLDASQAFELTAQVCEGLGYAHEKGVVHRDIKPENILIDARGLAKLADFGLAKLVEPGANHFSLTQTRQVLGTPRYMAPEQLEGAKEVDHRADLYSVGVVLYEMLVGVPPVGRFELPSKARPGIDEKADQVVLRALQHDPIHRYSRAIDLKNDLADSHEPALARNSDKELSLTDNLKVARDLVHNPAGGLVIVGLINDLFALSMILGLWNPSTLTDLAPIPLLLIGSVTFLGAYSFLSFKARWLGFVGCLFAILPISFGAILGGAIFGIWALSVMSRPEVIEAYRRNRKEKPMAADLQGPARALIAVGILNCLTLPVFCLLLNIPTTRAQLIGEISRDFVPIQGGVLVPREAGANYGRAVFQTIKTPAPLPMSLVSWMVFTNLVGIPIALGGFRMMAADHRKLVLTACILAALPITPVAIFGGLFAGIWALAVMTRPDVTAAFVAKTQGKFDESWDADRITEG